MTGATLSSTLVAAVGTRPASALLGPGGLLAQADGLIPRGTRVNVFQRIYWVFLVLGTLVGIVVIGYMLYNAYKYREDDDPDVEDGVDRPELGELPTGGGKGRKLFLSFAISAVIVLSLISWTYFTLLFVETAPPQEGDPITVEVTGYQFGWEFEYPNGHTTRNEMRIPADSTITIEVTSSDVFHNFGIPSQRVKTDAIPGQTTQTWFIADDTGTYLAQCYELCGAGHSGMTADVVVMEREAFQDWYANTTEAEA